MAQSGTVLFHKGQDDEADLWDDSELIQQYEQVSKDFKKSLKVALTDVDKKESRADRRKAKRNVRVASERNSKRNSERDSDTDSVRSSNEELNEMMKWAEWLKPVDGGVRLEGDLWSAGERCWAPFHTDGLMYPATVLRTSVKGRHTIVTVEFFGWANRVTLDARWLRAMTTDWKLICPDRSQPPGRPPPAAVRRALVTQFPHLAQGPGNVAGTSSTPNQSNYRHSVLDSMPPPPPPGRGVAPPSSTPHPACDCGSRASCSCTNLFDVLLSPPPLPPEPPAPKVVSPEQVTSALLHSWYTCGYKSGYVQGYLEAKKELLCSKTES